MTTSWQILALRYAENTNRTRSDSFVDASDPRAPHPMDFYFWVLRSDEDVIVVDTGMDSAEGQRRGRPLLRDPMSMLKSIDVDPSKVRTVVMTHLHFDHAGCLDAFPAATFHVQAKELAFANGPGQSDPAFSFPYTAAHIAAMNALVEAGRAVVHDGDFDVAPGVRAHLIGGHAAGLMSLMVESTSTTKLLASDVAHYYESITHRPIFHIVVDEQQMLDGYAWAWRQIGERLCRIIPAHDPKLRELYPEIATDVFDVSGQPSPAIVELETPTEWRSSP